MQRVYVRVVERRATRDFFDVSCATCLSATSLHSAMDPTATREARREALVRARQHNLDVGVIAKETVRMVLEQAFLVSGSLPS